MKTLFLLISLGLATSASCDRKAPWDNEVAVDETCTAYQNWQQAARLTDVPGTVVNEADTSKYSDWVYILASDKTRYFACNLPASVRKTGTRVVFNADEFMPPPTVRLAGVPVRLTRLRTTP